MSGPLERRLVRLEGAAGIEVALPVIFVSFGRSEAGDAPVATATVNGRIWHRAPNEAEAAFLARVGAEAKPLQPGGAVVGFLARAATN